MSGIQAASTVSTNTPARRPGSRRSLLAWTILFAAALVVVLWVVSVWWSIDISMGRGAVIARRGFVAFNWAEYDVRNRPSEICRNLEPLTWWFGEPEFVTKCTLLSGGVVIVERYDAPGRGFQTNGAVLLWPITLLTTLSGTALLISARRARRRALTHLCPACGYDLIGLPPNAPCPECGPRA
jgi:hypothetical protein